ncbi:MAG TPA: YraN family protein [Actinomycetota bacterium]|nr:YraN family protein [Actinomycetota bacterium]
MHERALFGRDGEDAAAALYESAGFSVSRNFRAGRIEVDLVATKPGLVVFCEVKTRASDRWGLPAEAVTPAKQARIRRAAAVWLAQHRPGPVEVRFDVVSAIVRDGRTELTHLPDAF